MTTIYEQLTHAYSSPRAILFSLGITSLFALLFGLAVGRSKRVWCRYLCPVGSIFSLLARCAALQFKVDRERWDMASKPLPRAVDCPLLLDVRRLRSNEKCSMCGRCSGHRGAVELGARWPGSEIVRMTEADLRISDVVGILLILIGVFFATSHATATSQFPSLHAVLSLGFLQPSGTVINSAILLALAVWIGLVLIAGGRMLVAKHLAYCLIPLGAGGAIMFGLNYSYGIAQGWGLNLLPGGHVVQLILLSGTALWSIVLGLVVLSRYQLRRLEIRHVTYVFVVGSLAALYILAGLPQ